MRYLMLALLACAGQNKIPEPSAKDQEEARKQIREIFREDYAKKAPADVCALGQKLLRQAQENRNDLVLTHGLLREAREKAVDAADAATAVEAVEQLSQLFSILAFEQKAETLDRLRRRAVSPEALEGLLAAYLAAIDQTLKSDRYEDGGKLYTGAEETAQKLDPAWGVEVKARHREFDAIAKEYKAVRKQAEILAQDAADPEANLAVGRFLCFVKNDYAAGLPLLARSSDAALRGLAEAELGKLSDVASFADIGERWYELAKKYDGKFEKRFQERAFYWFDRTWPKTTGIARIELDRRLNAREDLFGKANLLRLIDPQLDSKPIPSSPQAAYLWKMQDGILLPAVLGGMSKLEVPYLFPADWELEIHLEFIGARGSDLFFLFPPSSDGRCIALSGAIDQGVHRIAENNKELDLPVPSDKAKLMSRTNIFAAAKPARIIVTNRGGMLTVIANNRSILMTPWKAPKWRATLYLGCYAAAYQIHGLKVSVGGKRIRP